MGIKGLAKLLADSAPACVVVGRTGDQMLTNEAGEVTSHLQGMFFRTARLLESGMKPVYVFDGKPPMLKTEELSRRSGRREDATMSLEEAKEKGNEEEIAKYSKRTVRVTREHNDECRRLLKLMGVPIVDAPSEAEAQCAAMNKAGLVYAMSSEDMDSLTFGTPRLIRNLMAATSQKLPINDYEYDKVLTGLGLTNEQFIDMCILCGCDYCGTIRGIGQKRALELVLKHGSLEKVLANLDKGKYIIPEPFPFAEARELFKEPKVLPAEEIPPLKWTPADEEGIVSFLVGEKNFSEDRVRKAVVKLNSQRGKANQGRLDSFFGPAVTKSSTAVKRKEPEPKGKGKGSQAKKGKTAAKKPVKVTVKSSSWRAQLPTVRCTLSAMRISLWH
ncbi:hypothetical protein WJX73_007328 [Symbiochloris irregularis]|uniref:Flap endonuclease 1 n=1 Tax=Symbiochloris irregularis TaxID=706552 RepID=A0AAW1NNW0_9CHLO